MHIPSQTAGYAIVALSYLHGRDEQWVQAKDIAEATGIPRPYLSRILHLLGKSGLINTKRGYRGGVALTRPTRKITLLQVAEAIDAPVARPKCLIGLAECSDDRGCPAHDYWVRERARMRSKLSRLTLASVAKFEKRSNGRLLGPALAQRSARRSRSTTAKTAKVAKAGDAKTKPARPRQRRKA